MVERTEIIVIGDFVYLEDGKATLRKTQCPLGQVRYIERGQLGIPQGFFTAWYYPAALPPLQIVK